MQQTINLKKDILNILNVNRNRINKLVIIFDINEVRKFEKGKTKHFKD